MIGYNLYYVPQSEIDEYEAEPIYLHLSYGSWQEAEAARKTLETLYGVGRIEIDVKTYHNTYQPGEGY